MANRIRASKACQHCNQRKVKCDVSRTGSPCTRCKQRDIEGCEIIRSKRGTYLRKEKLRAGQEVNEREHTASTDEEYHNISTSPPVPGSEGTGQHVGIVQGQLPSDITASGAADIQAHSNAPIQEHGGAASAPPNPLESPARSSEGDTPASDVSSWPANFDYILENQGEGNHILDKASVLYMGESFLLLHVDENWTKSGKPRLHHPGLISRKDASEDLGSNHPRHMPQDEIKGLQAKGAFERPKPKVVDILVSIFFERVYPFYPIVNGAEFMRQYKAKETPWLLLHSICFIGATYCPLSVIHQSGFADRKDARYTYYKRAKALFDTGYEKNKVILLQSLILLSFWGGDPEDYWNFYTWIHTAVSIAESFGFHRSLAGTNMPHRDRSLMKRLWWILVTRDTFCGAIFGRPMRINLFQCDVEDLEPEDFEYDVELPASNLDATRTFQSLYLMEVSKLAQIVRDITADRFNPVRPVIDYGPMTQVLESRLQEWRDNLPGLLQCGIASKNIFALALSLLHDHSFIFLHLQKPDANGLPAEDPRFAVLWSVAQRISANLYTLMTSSSLIMMPHESFVSIITADVVLYTQMRKSDRSLAQLARSELKLTQMALHDIRDSWDSALWVMKLWSNLATRADKADMFNNNNNNNSNSSNVAFNASSSQSMGSVGSVTSLNDQSSFFEIWSGHPMFSNFENIPEHAYSSNSVQEISNYGQDDFQFNRGMCPEI